MMDNFTIFACLLIQSTMAKLKDGFRGERAFVLPPACISKLEAHPVASTLHITDIGYYPRALYHYRERREPLSQYVMIYCIEGSGWFEVDGHRHEVRPDTYFILPAGRPHAYGASETDPWTIYWIHFKGTLAGEFVPREVATVEIRPGLHSRIADRLDMFEEIMTVLDQGYSMENLLYVSSVFHHFLGSVRYLTPYRSSSGPEADDIDVVNASIRFMKENIEKKLKLGDIACYVGYSSSQFSLMFTNRTGSSPIAYFNELKIRRACNLLDFSNLKINQICYKIGISDSYYFSRLFTRVMGISPTAYRRQKKG